MAETALAIGFIILVVVIVKAVQQDRLYDRITKENEDRVRGILPD